MRATILRLCSEEAFGRLATNTIISIAIKVTAAGLSFLMFLFLSMAMTENEFGKLGFLISLATFLSVVSGCGMQTAILRWWPQYSASNRGALAHQSLVWGGQVTLGAALAVLALASAVVLLSVVWFEIESAYLFAGFTLIPVLALSVYVASGLRAQGYVLAALMPRDLLWQLGGCLIALSALAIGFKIDAIVAALSLAGMLAVLTISQLFYAITRSEYRSDPRECLPRRDMFRVAMPMWASSVLFAVTQNVGVVFLGLFETPEATGSYFAAVKIATLLNLILVASNMVSAPLISRLFQQGRHEELQRMLRIITAGLATPTLVIYVALLVCGGWLLNLFGTGYEKAYWPLVLLATGFAVNAICGPTGVLLQMAGQERKFLHIVATTQISALVSLLLLIPILGFIGAASVSMASLIAWNIWARQHGVRAVGIDATIFAWIHKR